LIGRFLKLAALAGDPIPVSLLLAHLGFAGEAREEMLDVLDESFGPEASNPLFLDFEYRHPGLPGQLVYAFSNPIARLEILRQMAPHERSAVPGDRDAGRLRAGSREVRARTGLVDRQG
jgi:hypothetical protein